MSGDRYPLPFSGREDLPPKHTPRRCGKVVGGDVCWALVNSSGVCKKHGEVSDGRREVGETRQRGLQD